MSRYILVEVDYKHLLVPVSNTETFGVVMAALCEAIEVESKGSGNDQRWVPTSGEPVNVRIVPGGRVTFGDDLATLRARLADMEEEHSRYGRYWSEEREKSARLAKELKALREAKTRGNGESAAPAEGSAAAPEPLPI